ncbi:flagellar biosynthetic protein FliO [Sinorhizobium sp. CCBAU 05631]|uniref:flagellar biosynthetic protein FliO n=1 Tax=Sinorhizobium sp. CCBAU 05631 TaxID=794846 RepID=UPI000BACE787|nr:flagellar biosynthetic protein FliO [Sinorhizobium sp. CCBAU 05631]ASY56743.1 procollagen, type VI, alpha 3 [Sinorhizobium sp. CCBAU 05631]
MMETLVGDNGSRFVIAAGAVAVGLLCLVAVLWIMRNRPSSPFVRGGKNRQPRLAVLDAAAVDTRRRLVLVRRDDVEHLIMIGGPTDIVIESRIVADDGAAAAAPVAATVEQPAPKSPVAPQQAAPAPQPVSASTPAEAAKQEPVRPAGSDEPPRAVPVREPEPAPKPSETVQQRPLPVEPPPRPEPVVRTSPPAPAILPVSAPQTPQDMLSAARERIVPMAQPSREERFPQPIAATREPPRPVQIPPIPRLAEPVAVESPTAVERPAAVDKAADFERFLDAEISGDLQRLSSTVAPKPEARPMAAARQEPILGPPLEEGRKEASIEEEMSRMLADISAGRKP